MRVLLTGATGFIGAAVLARLSADGHDVVPVVRRRDSTAARRLMASAVIELDIARATKADDWLPHLAGIDAVANCAGVLQDGPDDSTAGVHVDGMLALFAACEQAGVKRFIQISAIGIDREAPTAFSGTKRQGDEALMATGLDWVILRPSVVVGWPAYGGSALFRGAASMPVLLTVSDTGPLQIVQLNDVTRTVAFFLRSDAPVRHVVELAGPRRWSFNEIVALYRRWLGWQPARSIAMPPWLSQAMYRLGDLAGGLGWRAPIRSTARQEIARGAVGDPIEWQRLTGISPRDLEAALRAEPASVQERWFAGLYFLKPLIIAVLALFWLGTGLISLGPGFQIGKDLMLGTAAAPIAGLTVIAGALADIVIGTAIAFRRTARVGLWAALALSITYMLLGTVLIPQLWIEPLGPMLKIWPIMVLHLVALAILEDR